MSGPFKLKYKKSAFPFKSPLKHSEEEAGYKHPESMHKDYPPKEMDRIKKEDPKATFETPHQRDLRKGYKTKHGVGLA